MDLPGKKLRLPVWRPPRPWEPAPKGGTLSGERGEAFRRVEALDGELVRRYQKTWEQAVAQAPEGVMCSKGCTACCYGVFEISGLDALRLAWGFHKLAEASIEAARTVKRRAQEQWEALKPHFPGDPQTGTLAEDEGAREAFVERFSHLPCPLLDETTGACVLYPYRPLACRTFGIPGRWGSLQLAHCPLNFQGVSSERVVAATASWDPEDLEGHILSLLDWPPDTVVAAVIALIPQP